MARRVTCGFESHRGHVELVWECWTFECDVEPDLVQSEDGGVHLVAGPLGHDDCPLYVHLLSEDGDPGPDSHATLRRLVSRRIRITIETAD